jgi:hypothetical protein
MGDMNHPVLSAYAAIDAALDEIASVDPMYMSTAEKQAALTAGPRLRARVEALELRVLAASAQDVAEATGARCTATWVAQETRQPPATVRRHATLAADLDRRWAQVQAAFAAGAVNLAQVRVITDSLEALPGDLPDGVLVKAEAYLVEKAAEFGPRELRRLGHGVLEHLAPDLAEETERKRLEAEEARADAATRLWLRRRGDGCTDIGARVPDHVASRLRAYLDALANPHRPHTGSGTGSEFMNLPLARRRGIALGWLLENIADSDLPTHGGTATSIVVLLDYDTLLTGLGVATTSTGETLTAEQARRLACTARIIPAVLGKKGEILDQGRSSRLYTRAQRIAMQIRDRHCTAHGCTVPARYCHVGLPGSHGQMLDSAS